MVQFKASALLGALLLAANTHRADGHGVEVLSCLTTSGSIRIFIRHWHAALTDVLQAGQMVIDGNALTAAGFINDVPDPAEAALGALTGCSSPVMSENVCPSPGGIFDPLTDDDYVYYDFPGCTCGVEVNYELQMGTTEVLREGCSSLYPTQVTRTFVDSTAPTILVDGQPCDGASGIVVQAETSQCGLGPVDFAITTEDDCDSNPTVTTSTPSGDYFPVGTTGVTVTATDDAGRVSMCTFDVELTQGATAPPAIAINGQPCVGDSDIVVLAYVPTCTSTGGQVFWDAQATDDCGPNPPVTSHFPSGSNFLLGSHPTTATTVDSQGQNSQCTFTVQLVKDPIACPPDHEEECKEKCEKCVDLFGLCGGDAGECCEEYTCTQFDRHGLGRCIDECNDDPEPSPTPWYHDGHEPTPPTPTGGGHEPTVSDPYCSTGQWWADPAGLCRCNCPHGSAPGCIPAPPPITTWSSISACCAGGLGWVDPYYCDSRSRDTYSNRWFVDWTTYTCDKDCDYSVDGGRCSNPDHDDPDFQLYVNLNACCTRLAQANVNFQQCIDG